MPVYQQTYSHYSGEYRPRGLAWTVITLKGLKRAWEGKGFKVLLTISLLPFIVFTVQLYLHANEELLRWMGIQESLSTFLKINEQFYFNFLQAQQFFCFLIALIVGSNIIAQDRRTKAIALYLSKPLTRLDYLMGKGGSLLFLLYCVSLFPCLMLMFLYASFTNDWMYLVKNFPLALQIFLYAHLVVIPILLLIMMLSSLVKSRISAGAMLCVFYFIPDVMSNIFRELFDQDFSTNILSRPWWSLVSLQKIWSQLGHAIFKMEEETVPFGAEIITSDLPFDMSWIYHLSVLILFCVICSFFLYRQIRAVEVVK